MRKTFVLFIILSIPYLVFSQIRADFSFARFNAPGQSPYIETYFNFDGTSITYDSVDGGFQSKVLVTLYFQQDSTIKNFKKYEISSPIIASIEDSKSDFIDKQRFALEQGKYTLNIELVDVHNPIDTIKANQEIFINEVSNDLQFSDIVFIQDYEKTKTDDDITHAGYSLTPYVFEFFPTQVERIVFYTEFYGMQTVYGDSAAGIIRYYLFNKTTNSIENDYAGFQRIKPSDVNIVFNSFNIEKLPAGSYDMRFDAYDMTGNIVKQQSVSFSRYNDNVAKPSNPMYGVGLMEEFVASIESRDSLNELMMCVIPICDVDDDKFIRNNRKSPDNEIIRNFIISFWEKQDPKNPYGAWKAYELEVKKVNAEFSSRNSRGYATDRGFIYLKYGAPNTIRKQENEPSSYPYHIWHYYKHPKRSDARYIFYSTELSTNDYRLLHSNVIGEVNNPRWQRDLQRRNTPFGTVDDENVESQYGSWSEDLYSLPR